jgi:Kef-type K+ transport system membrane component KefB
MFDPSIAGVLVLACAVSTIFHYIKVPPVLGYLFAGAVAGPFGLRWLSNLENIEAMAELGLVFGGAGTFTRQAQTHEANVGYYRR